MTYIAVYHNGVAHRYKGFLSSRWKTDILKKEGFIKDYEVVADSKQGIIRVSLKYGANKEKVISGIKRISKPGLRVYSQKDQLPRVLGGLGIAVISTSEGMMTDKAARKAGLGGEVVAYVW